MRMLEALGSRWLADWGRLECVESVRHILISKIDEIVFFDFDTKPKRFTDKQLLRWERFSNARYWESLNRKQYYNARTLFSEMSARCNAKDMGLMLKKLVSNKYQELCQSKPQKEERFPLDLQGCKQNKSGKFFNLEYVLENVPLKGLETQGDKTGEKELENHDNKKRCKICGRDISHQKGNSVFCSERLYGKEAKRCRNKDSNKRMIVKRKILNSMKREKMLLITYEHNGEQYTDCLNPCELAITREWLDRVVSVVVIDKRTTKSKEEAKKVLIKNICDYEKSGAKV